MAQNDTPPQRAFHDDNTMEGISESPLLRTRKTIRDEFKRTRDLSTIHIHQTILREPGDEDKGADRFIRLFDGMVGKRGPYIDEFQAKWLVPDGEQLRHVIRETKVRASSLFYTLNAFATVVVVEPYSLSHKKLISLVQEFHAGELITAFPSKVGDGYDCYGNFAPPAGRDWSEGPLCTLLDNISSELKDLLAKLQQAHVERKEGKVKPMLEGFENKDVSVQSLENLIV